MVNTVNTPIEKTTKTFKFNKRVYQAGKDFARLVGLYHQDLIDKAVTEYIHNHQADIPVNITIDYSAPKVPAAYTAAIDLEASEHKRLLNQNIGKLQRLLAKNAPLEPINSARKALNREVAATRRFLKTAKNLNDTELLAIFKEVDKVLTQASDRIEGGVNK
jgi:hypothetical protein